MSTNLDEAFKQEGYDLMAAAFEVYNEKGSGFLEEVYHECLERELTSRNIPWNSKPTLLIYYKGAPLTKTDAADLLVFSEIIVELKAVRVLAPGARGAVNQLPKSHAQTRRLPHKLRFTPTPRVETLYRGSSEKLVPIRVH